MNTVIAIDSPVKSRITRTQSLDSLARLDVAELERRYRAAPEPRAVSKLEGHPTGRMLAVRRLDHGAFARRLRAFSGAASFPWGGKSFFGVAAKGTGANRVRLLGRHQLFPFLTYVGTSAIDGQACVVLDYDLPDNPSLIRAIHDEVREVDEGLFLGPAMWKSGARKDLVLWFALDTQLQAEAIGLPRRRGEA